MVPKIIFPFAHYLVTGNDGLVDGQMSNFDLLLRKLIYLRSIGCIDDNFVSVKFEY